MNVQYKRALITMILFGVLFLYLVIDYSIVGTVGFLDRTNFLLTALIILITMATFFFMLYLTNQKDYIVDERDTYIQQKATSIGLLVTTLFVFLLSISLFIAYEDTGSVPVSFMWLMAYLTFTVAYFCSSTIIVIMYGKDNAE